MTGKGRDSRQPIRSDQDAFPPSQLLRRNIERIRGEHILVAGVPPDESVASMFGSRRGTLLTFDYGAYLLFQRVFSSGEHRLRAQFSATYDSPDAPHDVAVVYLQKGSEFNHLVLSIVGHAVGPGMPVFLVGENKAGIRSNAAALKEHVGPIAFSDAARHCVLYEANATEDRPAVDLSTWEQRFSVQAGARTLSIVSLPGVFSHGRLDEGTAFLLCHLPDDLQGEVLDFGCGTGVIGAAIKAMNPECEITLVDSNALALESTARTLAANGLSAKSVRPSDVFTSVDGRFDLIVSNPPFHQGVAINYDVVSSFLSACERHLDLGGRLVIVSNKFLPYEGLMAKSLDTVAVVAQDQKYKVLSGRKRS